MTIGVPDDGGKSTKGEDGGARRPGRAGLWLQLQSWWLPLWLGTRLRAPLSRVPGSLASRQSMCGR